MDAQETPQIHTTGAVSACDNDRGDVGTDGEVIAQ